VFVYSALTGVISGDQFRQMRSEVDTAALALSKVGDEASRSERALDGVQGIGNVEAPRRLWHQLHHALSAFGRYRARVVVGLDSGYCFQEIRVYSIKKSDSPKQCVDCRSKRTLVRLLYLLCSQNVWKK